ncbi:asparaginyl endopeptidase 1 [Tanacetum coccineum]
MTPTSRLLLLLHLLVVMVMLLPKARAQHRYSTTWDLLLPLANNISLNITHYIRRVDSERHFLWNVYRTSSNSERLPTVVKELNEELTQWEYINSRINMIGLFLFGPEKYRSILSTIRDPKQGLADDMQCFASTWHMFYEHCGCLPKHCWERLTAFGNMCNYATDKAAIKEALAFACGMDIINPSSNNLYDFLTY